MPKPVCFPCQRFFRIKKSGFYFTEGMPIGGVRPLPGTQEPQYWGPYKLWAADLYECQGCGATILSGFGLDYIAAQHQEEFRELAERLGADRYQVNDC